MQIMKLLFMRDTDTFIGTWDCVYLWNRWFLYNDLITVCSAHSCKFYRCAGEVAIAPHLTVCFFVCIVITASILNYRNKV
jgi:hypothetical protein